jgi:hypothetical protein
MSAIDGKLGGGWLTNGLTTFMYIYIYYDLICVHSLLPVKKKHVASNLDLSPPFRGPLRTPPDIPTTQTSPAAEEVLDTHGAGERAWRSNKIQGIYWISPI